MEKDFLSYSPDAVTKRALEKEKADSIAALIKLLQPEPCVRCKTLENAAAVNAADRAQDKADLKAIRLACIKVFKSEGYARSEAIKGLYAAYEAIYGNKLTVKQADQQAYNEYLRAKGKTMDILRLISDRCKRIKLALNNPV